MIANANTVLDFWFNGLTTQEWFSKNEALDAIIATTFLETLEAAKSGKLDEWRKNAKSCLALIIVLDQFSRNIYRNQAQAFSQDKQARDLCKQAIKNGLDKTLNANEKAFLYMPLMHSEQLADHELATELFSQEGLEHNLAFEVKHKEIIERFGRYPHRNAILDRASTTEELAFLEEPGSGF